MKRLTEIRARLAEIATLLDSPEADIDALDTEVRALKAEQETIEKRARLVAAVATDPDLPIIRQFPSAEQQPEQRTFDASSPEYRTAWLKTMARNPSTGVWRLGDLTEVEKRAYSYTTAVTAVVPTGIQLGIVEMISKKYALLGDLNMTNFGGAVEFQQATVIAAGKAAATSENVANANDLQITFVKQTMSGTEIKGQVKIGHKMQIQSIDGFEAWLINELSREMGEVMNTAVFTALAADITAANKFETTTLEAKDVRYAFGKLAGGEGSRNVYANNFTIWNEIAAVTDEEGREKFIESSVNDDPAVQGRIYGSAVKLDETLADGIIWIGYPATIKANMFEAPNVLSDMPDVTTREVVYGGYALFEAMPGDTRSFVRLTVDRVVS